MLEISGQAEGLEIVLICLAGYNLLQHVENRLLLLLELLTALNILEEFFGSAGRRLRPIIILLREFQYRAQHFKSLLCLRLWHHLLV